MRTKNLGTAGFLALALAIATGCSESGSISGGTGRVQFVVGGGTAPAVQAATLDGDDGERRIDSAEIALSSILARNLDGELVDVSIDLPVSIDLIDLLEGHTVELPIGSLPVGSYDQLVIVIRSLAIGLSDGTEIVVTPPGGGWTAVVPTEGFEVVDGQVTTVSLRFRGDGAFRWEDDHVEFHPEFDCDVD